MTPKSQNQLILQALQEGEKLTPLDALERFGSFRLGARIYDLRQEGWAIKSTLIRKNGKQFSEYWIGTYPR